MCWGFLSGLLHTSFRNQYSRYGIFVRDEKPSWPSVQAATNEMPQKLERCRTQAVCLWANRFNVVSPLRRPCQSISMRLISVCFDAPCCNVFPVLMEWLPWQQLPHSGLGFVLYVSFAWVLIRFDFVSKLKFSSSVFGIFHIILLIVPCPPTRDSWLSMLTIFIFSLDMTYRCDALVHDVAILTSHSMLRLTASTSLSDHFSCLCDFTMATKETYHMIDTCDPLICCW